MGDLERSRNSSQARQQQNQGRETSVDRDAGKQQGKSGEPLHAAERRDKSDGNPGAVHCRGPYEREAGLLAAAEGDGRYPLPRQTLTLPRS